ncbi:MAG: hypothetical protein ACOCZ5_03690 [bacterium]
MSEFTDCYHLRTDDQEEAINLLKHTGLKGYVFPVENGWVTLVCEKYDFEENTELIAGNTGLLLHFIHGEDHGWVLTIYDGSKEVCHYHNIWEEGIKDDSKLNRELILKLIKENQLIESKPGEREIDSIMEDPLVFAEMVGLTNYEWISYYYVSMDYGDDKEIYNNVKEVD